LQWIKLLKNGLARKRKNRDAKIRIYGNTTDGAPVAGLQVNWSGWVP